MFKPLKVVAVRIPTVAIPEMLTLSKFVWPSTSKSPLMSAPVETKVP